MLHLTKTNIVTAPSSINQHVLDILNIPPR